MARPRGRLRDRKIQDGSWLPFIEAERAPPALLRGINPPRAPSAAMEPGRSRLTRQSHRPSRAISLADRPRSGRLRLSNRLGSAFDRRCTQRIFRCVRGARASLDPLGPPLRAAPAPLGLFASVLGTKVTYALAWSYHATLLHDAINKPARAGHCWQSRGVCVAVDDVWP